MKKFILIPSFMITALNAAAVHELQPNTVIRAVEAYPMVRVIERYKKDHGVPCEVAKQHLKELKRYLTLCALYPERRFSMFSEDVDNFWHTFLLFTKEYQLFCEQVAKRFIHHDPRDEVNKKLSPELAKIAYDEFAAEYMKHFGEMPPENVWNRKQEECETCSSEDKCCHHGDRCSHDDV